jgi:hypothetical protein
MRAVTVSLYLSQNNFKCVFIAAFAQTVAKSYYELPHVRLSVRPPMEQLGLRTNFMKFYVRDEY